MRSPSILILTLALLLAGCGPGTDDPDGGDCVPRTCEAFARTCGQLADGCGGTLDCGTCAEGKECSPQGACRTPCIPKTCEELGTNCGFAPNGCGRSVNCGACDTGEICGAGGTANVCAPPPDPCAPGAWRDYGESFFQRSCASCHRDDGFDTLSGLKRDSRVRTVMATGEMPQGRTLSATELAWALDWIDCGFIE